MKTALVIGAAGQDGSYVVELLRDKGYRVIGCVRSRQRASDRLARMNIAGIELLEWDMVDQLAIREILERFGPDEVYNFAAYSSGSAMFNQPVDMGEVNGLAVTRLLEAIRLVDPKIRLCQASSSEMFGNAPQSPQSEVTPFRPRTPYGAAKQYAHSMVGIYRQRFQLFACSAILFNHESPRRGLGFVTRKITHHAAKIKLGLAQELVLGHLDARRDWGYAGDFVRAMWCALQQPDADDYVVATGVTHSVRDVCATAFDYLGLDYRAFVKMGAETVRAPELVQLVGDASHARSKLGWWPAVSFEKLVQMMVDADLQLLSADKV